MKRIGHKDPNSFSLMDTMRSRISSYLDNVYSGNEGLLGNLDRWTQRRITDENLAKLALVFDSNDPVEACFRDLIREVDTEAETGIYLVRPDSMHRHLRQLIDEPGVTGELHDEITAIAPIVFADETAHSTDDLDLVWVTIQAMHDRAHVDATVSEIIMSYLVDDADSAHDVGSAMRALQYPFHEDVVRRRCNLPLMLNDQDNHELLIMVSELARRSGSYQARAAQIRNKAETG